MLRQSIIAGFIAFAASAAFAQEARVTDPQIAHIAYTAGQIDITAARLALGKTKNAEVHAFAETMLRDHAAVNDKALALVKRLKVTPQDNTTSKALNKQAAETEARLKKLSGPAFDRAYIENEVAYHRLVNDALRKKLIPNARNGELKALLETGLALFQEHQAHAEHLAQMVK
jgi:putative membrane protein